MKILLSNGHVIKLKLIKYKVGNVDKTNKGPAGSGQQKASVCEMISDGRTVKAPAVPL